MWTYCTNENCELECARNLAYYKAEEIDSKHISIANLKQYSNGSSCDLLIKIPEITTPTPTPTSAPTETKTDEEKEVENKGSEETK